MSYGNDKTPNNKRPGAQSNETSDMYNPYSAPAAIDPSLHATTRLSLHEAAFAKVRYPSMLLMILVPLAISLAGIDIMGRTFAMVMGGPVNLWADPNDVDQQQAAMIGNYIGLFLDILALACQAFIGYGAWQMYNLRKRGTALVACIISCVPCLSGCCIIGIPFGVWGLIVLNDPIVKSAFDDRSV